MEHEQLIPMMTKLPCHTQPSEGMTIPYHTLAGYDQCDPDSDPPAQLRDGAGFLEAPDPPAPSHYNTLPSITPPSTMHLNFLSNPLYRGEMLRFISSPSIITIISHEEEFVFIQ